MNHVETRFFPKNKIDLINLYRKINSKFIIEDANILEPAYCALFWNKILFESSPYENLINSNNSVSKISVKNKLIYWVKPSEPKQFLNAVNISNMSFSDPCVKRIVHIENSLANLDSLFSNEIEFIANFVSCIFWMRAGENLLGNAAFSEIPHTVFFSDYGLYSLPPEIYVPRQYSEYAVFENLYHEALHHQMHAYANLETKGYFEGNILPTDVISLNWRDRTFTLLEAFHALHIYSVVTPLRYLYFYHLKGKNNDFNSIEWTYKACQDGLRMWRDLSNEMLKYENLFKNQWKNFIFDFYEGYSIFSYDHALEKN